MHTLLSTPARYEQHLHTTYSARSLL
jgi:hypothetical protein